MKPSLELVYDRYLGGVLAISLELYGQVLAAMAKELERENDDTFRAEVRAYELTLSCYLD